MKSKLPADDAEEDAEEGADEPSEGGAMEKAHTGSNELAGVLDVTNGLYEAAKGDSRSAAIDVSILSKTSALGAEQAGNQAAAAAVPADVHMVATDKPTAEAPVEGTPD